MEIVVTPGETKLIRAFKDINQEIVLEPLLVGDIHIRTSDTKLTSYIFERKAQGDLDASIKDGRYHEQKERLAQTGCTIIYILEDLELPQVPVHRIWGAICNTMHRDKHAVFMTRSPMDTALYVTAMKNSNCKFPMENGVCQKNTLLKKESIAKTEYYKHLLILIPGVSADTADLIISQYPTLKTILLLITDQPTAIETLANLKRVKTSRRLGKKLAATIVEYLLELD